MTPTVTVSLWWLATIAGHLVLSSNGARRRLGQALGERGFSGVYSLVALATFVPLGIVYARARHTGDLWWNGSNVSSVPTFVLMALGLFMLTQSLFRPAPSAMGKGASATIAALGVTRITRHPLSMGFWFFGVAHMIVNGFATDLVFFGGWVVFVTLTTWHQDSRKRAASADYARFWSETSFVPFVAMLRGQQSLVTALRELKFLAVLVAAALFVLLVYFHNAWFGGVVWDR